MPTVYTAARVYDGLGGSVRPNGAVAVEGETIVYVGSQDDAPAGERIDLGDVTLLPGLIDMHVHLTFSASLDVVNDYLTDSDEMRLIRGVENARRALLAGVTTVRECGGQNADVFALREASQRRIIAAPRIIAAGGAMTTTGGHCWFFGLEADSEDEVRKAVRSQVKAGADYIKVMATGGEMTPNTNASAAQYSAEQMEAIVEEARRLGFRVAAHCHGTEGILNSARARVTTIEHCSFKTPDGLVYDEEAVEAIIDSGCYVCPTIGIGERAAQTLPRDHPLVVVRERTGPARYANLRRMWDRGIQFVSGSDAGVTATPFEDFANTITLLVSEVGLTPRQAIATATTVAAEALGRDDLGALKPGASADLLAVSGNPLRDISALWAVQAVVARGTRYK